jgi:hypothetical protein
MRNSYPNLLGDNEGDDLPEAPDEKDDASEQGRKVEFINFDT